MRGYHGVPGRACTFGAGLLFNSATLFAPSALDAGLLPDPQPPKWNVLLRPYSLARWGDELLVINVHVEGGEALLQLPWIVERVVQRFAGCVVILSVLVSGSCQACMTMLSRPRRGTRLMRVVEPNCPTCWASLTPIFAALNQVLMPQLHPNHAPRRTSLLSNPADWVFPAADGVVIRLPCVAWR
jgi:hypothetical protein